MHQATKPTKFTSFLVTFSGKRGAITGRLVRSAFYFTNRQKNYFRKGVQRIPRRKFAGFGDLVPVQAVFVLSPHSPPTINIRTWLEFYDGGAGRQVR